MLKIDLADFCRIVNGHIAHAIQLLLLQTKYSVTVAVRVTVNLKPDLIGMINILLELKLDIIKQIFDNIIMISIKRTSIFFQKISISFLNAMNINTLIIVRLSLQKCY